MKVRNHGWYILLTRMNSLNSQILVWSKVRTTQSFIVNIHIVLKYGEKISAFEFYHHKEIYHNKVIDLITTRDLRILFQNMICLINAKKPLRL